MKKTKLLKLLVAILIAIILFVTFTQSSFASHIDIDKLKNSKDNSNATNTAADITGKVLNYIQVVGAGIAIIMLIVIGIRWVSESPSGKAQLAKTSRYYILGAIFIFAAIGLVQIIQNFTKTAEKQITG